jgi:hypothetical protein
VKMELLEQYQNYVYLGGIILALLIFAWLMIRMFGGRVRAKRGARLGISEYYEVDKSRFLVLVRRDDVEHLVLIGGGQDVVIEQGIGAKGVSHSAPGPHLQPTADEFVSMPPPAQSRPLSTDPELSAGDSNVRPISPRPAPRPPVFGEPAPEDRAPNLRAVERDPD